MLNIHPKESIVFIISPYLWGLGCLKLQGVEAAKVHCLREGCLLRSCCWLERLDSAWTQENLKHLQKNIAINKTQ